MSGFTEAWLEQHRQRMARTALRVVVSNPDALPTPEKASAKAPAKRTHAHHEDDLQKTVAEYLDWALPHPWRWFHVPNGGKREPREAARLSGMGVKPGAPDVLIMGPLEGGIPWIWIELKSATGVLSPEQKEWRHWCMLMRAPWFCCRSLDEVYEAVTTTGIPLKGRP